MEVLALISWSHGKESVVNVVTLVSPTKKKTTLSQNGQFSREEPCGCLSLLHSQHSDPVVFLFQGECPFFQGR